MSENTGSPSLRYAANLKWLFTELPFLDRFAAAAQQGFKGVEIASPYEFEASELGERLYRERLNLVLINTPAARPGEEGQNGYACIPGKEAEFRDGIRKALHYAGELDCGFVHLLAGRTGLMDTPQTSASVFSDNLMWALDAAKGTGVRYLLECLNQTDAPGYFLRSLEHTGSVVSQFAPEEVGLLFDVYHCQMSGEEVGRAYCAHEPIIQHIQFADAPGRHEPGTGEIPWSALNKLLKSRGYGGWVGCEYRPLTSTTAGLGWRTSIL
jgi:hydroxypyruvate isomerase